MKKSYFIVSDVHGFFDELQIALQKRGFQLENPQHRLIICGDLFDRGPKPRELFEFCKSLGDRLVYVRGNHEDLLEECIADIASGRYMGSHHFHNGTVKTIADICGLSSWDVARSGQSEILKSQILTCISSLMEWIRDKSINYYELDDYIFVHGWIPTADISGDSSSDDLLRPLSKDQWDDCSNNHLWRRARWTNGMEAWKQGCKLPNKTIVCGHFHCSWGWSHIDQKLKEFPQKSKEGWENSFQPYIREGIVALDACTAYSNFINCIKLEVGDDV